jgi:hypothetical protein
MEGQGGSLCYGLKGLPPFLLVPIGWTVRIFICNDKQNYGLDNQGFGFRVPLGTKILTFPCRPDRLWGPPNLLSNGYPEDCFLRGVKQQECEADHTRPTGAEIKETWIYTSTPPIHLHCIVLNCLSRETTLPFYGNQSSEIFCRICN